MIYFCLVRFPLLFNITSKCLLIIAICHGVRNLKYSADSVLDSDHVINKLSINLFQFFIIPGRRWLLNDFLSFCVFFLNNAFTTLRTVLNTLRLLLCLSQGDNTCH